MDTDEMCGETDAALPEDKLHLQDAVAGGTHSVLHTAGPGGGPADLPTAAAPPLTPPSSPEDYRSGDLHAVRPAPPSSPEDYRSGDLHAVLPAPPSSPQDYRSGDLHAVLPAPPSSQQDYRSGREAFSEQWLENPYERVGLGLTADYVPMCSSPSWPRFAVSQRSSSSVRGTLYCRSQALLLSLWILSLLGLAIVLGLYLRQKTPQTIVQEISTLQNDLRDLKQTTAQLISELQMEVEDLDHFYGSVLMCSPNDSSPLVLDKIINASKKDGIIINPVWRWIRAAAVGVTLDPDSAHPSLVVSESRQQVRLGARQQSLPDSPRRFDYSVGVLGRGGFTSGRRYWEVGVAMKTDWTVGVALSSASRKGPVLWRPRAGYWVIRMKHGALVAMGDTPTPLPLRAGPRTVGVYLDYEGGQVSFYNVEARTHIYSFTGCTFSKKLYPVFRPGLSDGGKNSAPLVISPVSHVP